MSGGAVVIRRLHRMVRAGFRPWLGYGVAGGGDQDIQLRRRDANASLAPDGTLTFDAPFAAAGPGAQATVRTIDGGDAAGFDAAFPPDRPNRRNLVRRLYEIGFGAW